MKLLSAPPNLNGGGVSSAVGSSICQNITTVQGISVCEDRIDFQHCEIISSISSNMCDHFGSLQFEKYWSQRGCKVRVFHLFIYIKGNVCNTPGKVDGGSMFFLSVCVYVCMYVCMYVRSVFVYRICMNSMLNVCMYVEYIYIPGYVFMFECIYCMYVCTICMYVR